MALSEDLEEGEIIVGRQMMTCCADDIAFAGLVATNNPRGDISNGQRVELTAAIKIMEHPGYDRTGPVLKIREITPCEAPEETVASFM